MIDLAGLVIGTVALGTVFSTMIHVVQIIEKAKTQHEDLEYFEVMIRLQGIRLYSWAKAYQPLVAQLQGDEFFELNNEALAKSLQVMTRNVTQPVELFEKHGFTSSRPAPSFLAPVPSQMSLGYPGSLSSHQLATNALTPGPQHVTGNSSSDLVAQYFDRPVLSYIPVKPEMKRTKPKLFFAKFRLKTAWAVNDTIALEAIASRIVNLTDTHDATLKGLQNRAEELSEARAAQERRRALEQAELKKAAQQKKQSRWRRGLRKIAGYKESPTLLMPKTLTYPSSSDVSSIDPNDLVRV